MYRVENVSSQLVAFDGKPLGKEGVEAVSVKKVLVDYLGIYQGRGVAIEELVKAYELGTKIFSSKEILELEDKEVEFIKTVIGAAPQPLYTALVLGQTFKKIEDSKVKETISEELKV